MYGPRNLNFVIAKAFSELKWRFLMVADCQVFFVLDILSSGIWEFPKIWSTLFWGPYNKDPTIYIGYYIRVPYFRKLPFGSTRHSGMFSVCLQSKPRTGDH